MAISAEETQKVIKQYQLHPSDTGSPEVQVALLTADIKQLTEHFKVHRKDVHSRRGLVHKVNERNSLLAYLKREDFNRYIALVKSLGLRHAKKAAAAA